MNAMDLVATRCLQRHLEGVGHILSTQVRAELPQDDVAAVIIQDCAEIEPASADDLQVGDVSLPKLVDAVCLVFALIGGLNDDDGRGW